ncbi:MAG: hypothetical protein WBM86_13565 [Waterburya sp.]
MTVLDKWLEETTEVDPLDVNLDAGLELFDRTFDAASKEQLPVVGYYLERLSNLLGEHTEEWWTDWNRRSSGKELEIEADFFDCYLQQSVGFDADIFIEPLPIKERQYTQPSKPVKIPSASLEEIIDESQSHAEDVPGWSKQIESYLQLHGLGCMMTKLIDDLPLTPGAIIYTLLLGDFHLEQEGDDFLSTGQKLERLKKIIFIIF